VLKKYILFTFIFITTFAQAQHISLSETSEVSILSLGPGDNLNDSFGHCAFRINDQQNGIDRVYDYGRYDFNTPNFYLKFAQGKLLYELGTNNYQPFFNYYKNQNRWVKEQILDLNYTEKQALFNFLQNNSLPENKKYLYDFFYDNCATKIPDVLEEVVGDKLVFKLDHITEDYTFRGLIQKNVNANTWGSLGMDVAIGAVVDRKPRLIDYQFLPEYIFKGADNAIIKRTNGEVPLVKRTVSLFTATTKKPETNFFASPLFIFSCIGLLILFITYKDFKNKKRTRALDATIFFITGIIGVFILLLWFGTDHSTTANNYNLLWASPLSILFFISILKKEPKAWLRKYLFFLLLCFTLLLIHWITGVQVFAIGLIPLFITLAIRYLYLLKYLKSNLTS
jgi:hypothetical protein